MEGIGAIASLPARPSSPRTPYSGPRPWMPLGTVAAPQPMEFGRQITPPPRVRQIAMPSSTRAPLVSHLAADTYLEIFLPPSPGGEVRGIRTRISPSSNEPPFERGRLSCSNLISRTRLTGTHFVEFSLIQETTISGCLVAL